MTDERLPDAELELLGCLWRHGECTARELREHVESQRPMSHSSVMTLLGRLESKSLVSKRKGEKGKAFLYQAVAQPAPTRKRLVSELLRRAFAGDGVALFASLLETQPPDDDEVKELQDLLNELEKKRRR